MKWSLVSVLVTLFLPLDTFSAPPPTAINPERGQLLSDALSWMTFRLDGILLTESDLAPYRDSLRDQYRSSKLFKSFVIAFHLGVLPKLTLQDGDSCDPDYTKLYKDPYNNSVTWYQQKQFTFDMYYQSLGKYQGSSKLPAKLCDYRQGLVCLESQKKCGCAEGSKLETIEPSSTTKRCLLESNVECALVDFGQYSRNTKLTENLDHLIFNLEKPLGCQHGTQCRYKNDEDVPKCYPFQVGGDSKNGWTEPQDELPFGAECSLDLYADKGMCGAAEVSWIYEGNLICYNFWGYLPQRAVPSTASRTTGFCASELAPFVPDNIEVAAEDIGDTVVDPFIRRFVNPRTVPLRNPELSEMEARLYAVSSRYQTKRRAEDDGDPCSVQETKKLAANWQYFQDLDKTPSNGQAYQFHKNVMMDKVDEVETIMGIKNFQAPEYPKLCRVEWQLIPESPDGDPMEYHYPLECVATGAADSKGHDGKCQRSKSNDTLPPAQVLLDFFAYYKKVKVSVGQEEDSVDEKILTDNPEVNCTLPGGVTGRSGAHPEVLEGGLCPSGHFCQEDFTESSGIYENLQTCTVDEAKYVPKYVCHKESGAGSKLDKCEEVMVKKKIEETFDKMKKLEAEAVCDLREREARKKVLGGKEVSYQLLTLLEEIKVSKRGICDATKLLECSAGKCQCIANTKRRWHVEKGKTVYSDHCYLASGPCTTDVSTLLSFTTAEKSAVSGHYAKGDCSSTNVCVFVDPTAGQCTGTNPNGPAPPPSPPGGPGPTDVIDGSVVIDHPKKPHKGGRLEPYSAYIADGTLSKLQLDRPLLHRLQLGIMVIAAVVLF